MLRTRSLFALPALTLAAAFALTACAAPAATDSADSTSEDSERSLVVYAGRDAELIDPLIEQFEEESGITMSVRYAGTTELAAQLIEEGDRTPAQVFLSQDAGALGALAAEGLLAPLPEELTSLVPADLTSSDGTWIGLTGRARVVAYDSETYSADEVPGDVRELTNPEWASKVGIAPSNASFQSFVTAMRVADGEEAAQEWLEGLVANDAQIFAKNGEILEAVNSGAVGVGLINHYYWAGSEQDPATLRAQLKFGEPGTVSALINVTGAGILTGSADSAEAREFLDFLVSETAQTYFVEQTFEYPLVGDIAGPAGVPSLDELDQSDIDLADLSSLEETIALIQAAGLL